MKKSILNIGRALNKTEQKKINGGREYGECLFRYSFDCGVPDHICCNFLCVLPTHPACGF